VSNVSAVYRIKMLWLLLQEDPILIVWNKKNDPIFFNEFSSQIRIFKSDIEIK
jgi:hypothetical protein